MSCQNAVPESFASKHAGQGFRTCDVAKCTTACTSFTPLLAFSEAWTSARQTNALLYDVYGRRMAWFVVVTNRAHSLICCIDGTIQCIQIQCDRF